MAAPMRRDERLLRIAVLSAMIGGLIAVLLSAALPWYRMGGTILAPQPGCTVGGGPFVAIAGVLSLSAALAALGRDRAASSASLGLSAATFSAVLVAGSFGFLCADCGCTGGSGVAYGWILAAGGAATSLAGSAVGFAWTRSRGPRR